MNIRILISVILVIFVSQSSARDRGQFGNSSPERREWFKNLKSEKGSCCADADGTALTDAEWKSENGHYSVFIDNQWITVPDDAVLKGPNMDGRTIVWPIRGYLGISIRCFIPGTMI